MSTRFTDSDKRVYSPRQSTSVSMLPPSPRTQNASIRSPAVGNEAKAGRVKVSRIQVIPQSKMCAHLLLLQFSSFRVPLMHICRSESRQAMGVGRVTVWEGLYGLSSQLAGAPTRYISTNPLDESVRRPNSFSTLPPLPMSHSRPSHSKPMSKLSTPRTSSIA